jgi:uncharacterized protein YecE (DUF72 family)
VGGEIRIGTSGWEYRHWAGDFYPAGLPRARWLEFYTREFTTVELNNPFYRLPQASVFEGWAHRVPADFRFAVKASRYLTHLRRLREPEEPLERLWTRARHLGPRLGPVLYQLPPRWKPNLERLEAFLMALPDAPQVIELGNRAAPGGPLRVRPIPRRRREVRGPVLVPAPGGLGGSDDPVV